MKVEVQKSFEKDIAKVKDKGLAIKVLAIINLLKSIGKLSEIPKLKKLNANDTYYRIRVGDYRIGLKVNNETLILLRFMDRKDIYKFFP
jgi:mRNA interferase RelE/StbE